MPIPSQLTSTFGRFQVHIRMFSLGNSQKMCLSTLWRANTARMIIVSQGNIYKLFAWFLINRKASFESDYKL